MRAPTATTVSHSAHDAMAGPYVVALADLRGEPASQVGNKAGRLAQALLRGCAVPDGFVVTTAAFRRFLEAPHASGRRLLDLVLTSAAEGDPLPAPGTIARSVAALFGETPLPDEIALAIDRAYRGLPRGREGAQPLVAVRSSAPDEDGSGRSLAGHFDSFLDVSGEEPVREAVRRCFASAWSERALAARLRARAASSSPRPAERPADSERSPAGYEGPGVGHRANGEDRTGSDSRADMAVLVQLMVRGGPGGVLFTRDPVAARDRMVVEYSARGAERVALGDVMPLRFAIDRSSLEPTSLGGQAEPDPSEAAELAPRLGRLGLELEALFGAGQDIEWSVGGDGQLYLLQSRPITASVTAGDIWTAANSQEAIEDPVTPLTYTFLAPWIERGRRRVFDLLEAEAPGGEYMRLFSGRIYFNTHYFRRFLERLPGIPPEIFDMLLFGDLGEIAFPHPPLEWRTLRIAWTILRTWSGARRRMDQFTAWLDARIAEAARVDLGRLGDEELLLHMRRVAPVLEHALNLHVLGSAMAGGHYLLLRKFLHTTGIPLDESATDELLAGAKGIETARSNEAIYDLALKAASLPAVRALFLGERPRGDARAFLDALAGVEGGADFRRALEAFLAEFGHRAEKEAELAHPRWREDPGFVLGAIGKFLELGVGGPQGSGPKRPADVALDLHARRGRLSARIARGLARAGPLGLSRAVFRFLQRSAERAAPYRENMRFHGLRALEKVRDIFLEIGRRLAARGALERGDDVFFLEAGEALRAIARGARLASGEARMLRDRTAERRARYVGWLARPAPPKLLHENGTEAAAPPRAGAERRGATSDGTAVDAAGRRYLEGVPVSRGIVTGRVRLIERLEDGLTLRPDEILLASAATPSWTPLFFFARGVILDIGGMLSHCAVIAREYGIPCVVGLKTATAVLKDGDTVTVDAHKGRVYLP